MVRKGRQPVDPETCKVQLATTSGPTTNGYPAPVAEGYVGRFDGSEAMHASPAMAAASQQKDTGSGAAATDPSALPTSTKWSVLSSRVEGLVAELSEVVGKQDAYCVSQSKAEGPAMCAVREKMLATPWAEEWAAKRTMFSYGEEMSTDPLEAMLLKQLVFLATPRRVLEIGMFVGYGSVAMLEGSPVAQVVSLEIDPYLKGWLSSCMKDHPDMSKRHEIVVGPALESLPKLEGEFDLVFVDANKAEYRRYVELILEHKLLSPSGVIICDNILYNGYPYVHSHFDAQPQRRNFGDAIREFNQWIADNPALEQVVLPIRDGISFVRQSVAGVRETPKLVVTPIVASSCSAGPPLSRPSFDLGGSRFIVTGGTQGLGLEIARQLKACGASALALLSRTRSKGEAAVAELSGAGCVAFFVEADMSDPASVEAAWAEAIKVLDGRVDGLVNAAGTTERGNLMNTTVDMFNRQFDINTRAPFLLSQAVSKHWIAKGSRGSIVNISSIAAKGGAPFICAYSASKAALNVLTANNAAELAPHGIRVNAVNMGWTLTDNENDLMVKKGGPDWLSAAEPGLALKRIMHPVDVACTVLFLLSPAAQMMTGNCVDLHPDTALGMLSLKSVDSLER